MGTGIPAVVKGTPVGVPEPTADRFIGVVFGEVNGTQCWLRPSEFAALDVRRMFPWRQPTRARGGKPRAPERMPAYDEMPSRHVVLPADLLAHSVFAVESRAEADVTRLLVYLGIVANVVPQAVRIVLPHGGHRTIDLCGVDRDGAKHLVSVTAPGENDKRRDLDDMGALLADAGVSHRVMETPSPVVRNNLDLWWMHRAWVPEYEEWIDDLSDVVGTEGTTMRFLADYSSPCEHDRGWLVLTALHLLARRVLVVAEGYEVEFGPDRLIVPTSADGEVER